jgi:glycogen(starch) synthase
LALRARRFGADLAIIDSGTTHFFALTIFRLFGVRVAVNLHNVMWPVGYEPTGLNSLIRRLNRWFFRNVAAGGIGCSPECERQVLQESRSKIPFFQYRCQFSKDGFKPSAGYSGGPFRIVCASRAEVNKGILDLIPIAARLRSTGAPPVIFDVCGNGPALGELEKGVAEASLNGTVIVHGRVERAELLDLYSKSHAVIVPTRSTFTEGMPMVCAEAMLSSLPVITNPVTNAADVIGDAILLARTDDANSYAVEIRKLIEDKPLYQSLRLACARYVDQFVDPARGYAVSVDSLIKSLLPGLVN